VIGNDQMHCGNVASTYYVVTPMKDPVHPLRDGEPYVICSDRTGRSSPPFEGILTSLRGLE